MSQTPAYGGQAVVEGVMFAGQKVQVTAIRRKNDTLEYFSIPRPNNRILTFLKKIPFIRGIAGIVESASTGAKHLTFSTEMYEFEEEGNGEAEPEQLSKAAIVITVAIAGVLSFLFGKFVFTLVPAFLADLLLPWFPGHTVQILLEGLFKIILLFGYISLIALTPMIKRLFQYHGAEHKVINTFENGKELTVENVLAHSRLHYRCGSSFMVFTVFVGVILYLFFQTDELWPRILSRIALIPVDIGISYEVLKLTNACRDIRGLRWLGYPGLWLQLLTTKEPDAKQAEVAIASFKEMLRQDAEILDKNGPMLGKKVEIAE